MRRPMACAARACLRPLSEGRSLRTSVWAGRACRQGWGAMRAPRPAEPAHEGRCTLRVHAHLQGCRALIHRFIATRFFISSRPGPRRRRRLL